jgi:hypothetical protein
LWLLFPGIALAALLGIVVWRAQADGSLTGSLTPRASLPAQMPQPLPVTTPLDTVTGQLPPDATAQQKSLDDEVARAALAVEQRDEGPTPAEQLWTQTWVNVRERPGTTSTVIKILTPGQPVDVINPERQWSLVYVDGQVLGYLSVALLAERPPGL